MLYILLSLTWGRQRFGSGIRQNHNRTEPVRLFHILYHTHTHEEYFGYGSGNVSGIGSVEIVIPNWGSYFEALFLGVM